MKTSHWFASAIGAAALGFLAMPAQAAPVGALTGNAVAAQGESASTAEQVRHRCYRRDGRLFCPKHYRSYGYGPGISLYFGGRRGHHNRNWRRW